MFFQFILDTNPAGPVSAGGFGLGYLAILLVFLIVVFVIIRLAWKKLSRPELHGMDREVIAKTWQQLLQMSEQGVMGAKLSVIEADKLLDQALKSMMMPGETLGERLKSAGYKYPSLRQVWNAHRLRNQLVHDASFEITIRQAKQALRDFEAALKTLNVM